jgi:phosphatidylserine decarboxylase
MSEIRFFNRLTGRMETEKVYGEGALKWIYGTRAGRLALHALVKRKVFSAWYGWRMDARRSRRMIRPFIEKYGLDASEFADPADRFTTFNEFFYRRLKPGARPVDEASDALVFPADGRHLLLREVGRQRDFLVKGVRFDLAALLGSRAQAADYEDGDALISRLCPVDYHRFHFPCGGRAGAPIALSGSLYSVSPLALVTRPSILWENKRYVTEVESETFGRVLFLEIGATCVGAVVHTVPGKAGVAKGQEKGYFRFGGSSVITLVKRGRVRWSDDLVRHSAEGIEVFARMGDRCGVATRAGTEAGEGGVGGGGRDAQDRGKE